SRRLPADLAGRQRQPVERVVMEDHRLAIGARLHVAFNRKSPARRLVGGAERILDHAATLLMEPAMGDRPGRQPGRRVDAHQAISNMASTSAIALSGKCATPTVV